MWLAPPAGLRSTCMAPSSGWIKFSLRWGPRITLFHLCLKWPPASAPCKLLSLACTWRMDASDTIENWQRSLDNTWPLWPTVGFRNLENLGNILLISRTCLVYIITFCRKITYRAYFWQDFVYSQRRDGQARDRSSVGKNGPKRFFCVWHFKVIVWQKLALIVFLKRVFIRFGAHAASSFHGFS